MKLSALFSDGMILQREEINKLWGYINPNQVVNGSIGGKRFSTTANNSGYFELDLPNLPVGGPYTLNILADDQVTINNVMVGDVFLLGGQSNMELPINRTLELYRDEIKDTFEPDIRLFEVPKEYSFQKEREEIYNGRWIQACGDDLLEFSAAAFFTAKEIKNTYNIPIGFIQTAVGGTPAKAWCSEDTINKMKLYTDELEQCKVPGYPEKVEEMDSIREQDWLRRANEAFNKQAQKKEIVKIPGLWNKNELEGFHGAIRLTKEFNLSKEDSIKDLELVFGAVIDADKVYINGSYIGETGYRYPPRYYSIPQGVLKEGKNVIEVQMLVFRDTGGFMPGKQYGLRTKYASELLHDLSGDWTYEIMKEMEVLPDSTFFTYKATGLYKGMLSPVRKWNISGFLYYQGESNIGNSETYSQEMKSLIGDWRKLWKQNELPFIFVQLAGFCDGDLTNQGTDWSVLREKQEETLDVANTAMVVTYDIGEYNDLHPMNKKTLGKRLALAIGNLIYKEDIVASGPRAIELNIDKKGQVSVRFTNVGSGFLAKNSKEDNEIYCVELMDDNGDYNEAKSFVKNNELVVYSENINNPQGIRYAWKNYPAHANLYNKEGLPALPFRREWG